MFSSGKDKGNKGINAVVTNVEQVIRAYDLGTNPTPFHASTQPDYPPGVRPKGPIDTNLNQVVRADEFGPYPTPFYASTQPDYPPGVRPKGPIKSPFRDYSRLSRQYHGSGGGGGGGGRLLPPPAPPATFRHSPSPMELQSDAGILNSVYFSPESNDIVSTGASNQLVGVRDAKPGEQLRKVQGDKSEHFETTTCWIAAEHALHHARSKISAVSEVFKMWNLQEPEYVILAGFDESLIKSGVGYLEQVHIFVSAKVDVTPPLLSELGRIFSPFSSILFTESSSYYLPVFKDDGNIWEFNELIYSTASKFADGGSSAKMPLTVISLSHTPGLADGMTGFSQGSFGGGNGEKNVKRRLDKGKGRDRGEDGDDNADNNDNGPDDDPEEPVGDLSGVLDGPAEICFEIVSEIYSIQAEQNIFQKLTVQGRLTIQTSPPSQNPRRFSKRHVEFTQLIFSTQPTTGIAYKQFHVRVVVDSHQEDSNVEIMKPKRSPAFDGEEKELTSSKKGRSIGLKAALIGGLHPTGSIEANALWTDEGTSGLEKKRYTSGIVDYPGDGVAQWDFHVDDDNFQKRGIDMPGDKLPTVRFEFASSFQVPPAPPPNRMDIMIASYWSTTLQSGPSEPRSWISNILRLRPSSNPESIPYSNLFQIVALKTVPSNLPKPPDPASFYKARVRVQSGYNDSHEVKLPVDPLALDVTPATVFDDPQGLSNLNLIPTIAKFELSDNCIQILENWQATSFVQ